jgi:hypothetical protein
MQKQVWEMTKEEYNEAQKAIVRHVIAHNKTVLRREQLDPVEEVLKELGGTFRNILIRQAIAEGKPVPAEIRGEIK